MTCYIKDQRNKVSSGVKSRYNVLCENMIMKPAGTRSLVSCVQGRRDNQYDHIQATVTASEIGQLILLTSYSYSYETELI